MGSRRPLSVISNALIAGTQVKVRTLDIIAEAAVNVSMPREDAIIFRDLVGKLGDASHRVRQVRQGRQLSPRTADRQVRSRRQAVRVDG